MNCIHSWHFHPHKYQTLLKAAAQFTTVLVCSKDNAWYDMV